MSKQILQNVCYKFCRQNVSKLLKSKNLLTEYHGSLSEKIEKNLPFHNHKSYISFKCYE